MKEMGIVCERVGREKWRTVRGKVEGEVSRRKEVGEKNSNLVVKE